ncbi:unnamed protein product, partial [Ectocarpus sp. 12 AP-2014]
FVCSLFQPDQLSLAHSSALQPLVKFTHKHTVHHAKVAGVERTNPNMYCTTQQVTSQGAAVCGVASSTLHDEAMPPVAQQAATHEQSMARCKSCGEQFARKPGANPASAQFHRCESCNKPSKCGMLLDAILCCDSCSIQ